MEFFWGESVYNFQDFLELCVFVNDALLVRLPAQGHLFEP